MPTQQSSYDKARLVHINNLMDSLHNSTNEIYESLVDREFDKLKETITELQTMLKDIYISIDNEI
jgi:mevalonate kinase